MGSTNYRSWSRDQLRQKARELDIAGREKMTKAQLLDAVTETSRPQRPREDPLRYVRRKSLTQPNKLDTDAYSRWCRTFHRRWRKKLGDISRRRNRPVKKSLRRRKKAKSAKQG